MRLNHILTISGFLLILFLVGCTDQINQKAISLKEVITDKEVYHSSEIMNITTVVYSPQDLDNVTVSVNGINNRLNKKQTLELNQGLNEISFTYKLPRCNVCGGIREGDYNITVEVTSGDNSLTKVKTVSIRQ